MDKRKVLLVVTELELGGAQQHVLQLASHLPAEKYDVFLATGDEGLLLDAARKLSGIRLHLLPQLVRRISPVNDVCAWIQIYRLCARERIEIVHTHSSKAGILGRWAARLAGVRAVLHTVHGWGFYRQDGHGTRPLLVWLERATARITHRLIAVSRAVIDVGLRHGIGTREQYVLVHHGIDPAPFTVEMSDPRATRKMLGLESDGPVVTMIACFKPQKAPLEFVELAARVRGRVPSTRFVMVGDGDLRPQIESAVSRHGLRDTLRLVGWRRDIPALLRATDVLVLTSRWEGLPGTVLEAMATGVPVVCNAVGGIPEIVTDGLNGFLTKPGDIDTMAARVVSLLTEPGTRQAMAAAAKAAFSDRFDMAHIVRQVDQLYEETTSARLRAAPPRTQIPVAAALLPVDIARLPFARFRAGRDLRALGRIPRAATYQPLLPAGQSLRMAYFVTDCWTGAHETGGSLAHIRGVVTAFAKLGNSIFFVASRDFPFLRDGGFRSYHLPPPPACLPEVRDLVHNRRLMERGQVILREEKPSFVYQRLSRNTYASARLAGEMGIPLVVEYNGPITWESRHWGKGPLLPGLTNRIERAVLRRADLIVTVSQPLLDALTAEGIAGDRILVLPNGVDPERFHPGISASRIRRVFGFDDHPVIGFAGTFGRWHGADVLVRAAKAVTDEIPNARFLFMGEGKMHAGTKRLAEELGIRDQTRFVGTVPYEAMPEHLATCEVLVSPHVPNPDGTAFFGSPTKLFEYMAMGKAIVASNLGQIGEVLTRDESALLTEPGNAAELAAAIIRLTRDPELRRRLGEQARRRAVSCHTWDHNVRKMVNKLTGVGA